MTAMFTRRSDNRSFVSGLARITALLALAFFFCLPTGADAQLDVDTKVGLGLSTFWVNGAGPTRENVSQLGAGFNGQQPGIGARARFAVGENKEHIAVVNMDYYFLRGRERIPFPSANLLVNHERDIFAMALGYQYEFIDFNRIARAYAGVEYRASNLMNENYRFALVSTTDRDTLTGGGSDGKGDVWRMGPALRLGIIGQFEEEFYVDVSLAYSGINMFGLEESRGPLFTHEDFTESAKETLIGTILFSITVMYQL